MKTKSESERDSSRLSPPMCRQCGPRKGGGGVERREMEEKTDSQTGRRDGVGGGGGEKVQDFVPKTCS